MRNTDPRLKLFYLTGVLAIGMAAKTAAAPLCQGIIAIGLILGARPVASRLKILLLPFCFAAAFFLAHTLFAPGMRDTVQLPGLALPYSPAGLEAGLLLAARVMAGTLTFFWFAVSTEFTAIRTALVRLRVPLPMVAVLGMTWRYLSVYDEEAGRMKKARMLRLGFAGWRGSLASVSAIGGQTLIRAFDHSERTYQAMRTRGFNGSTDGAVVAPYQPLPSLRAADVLQAFPLWLLLLTAAAVLLCG